MTLESWLLRATHNLAPSSAEQVRREIQQHYSSAIESGAGPQEAVASLGTPEDANRQYRKVLLTVSEAKLLNAGAGETRFLCRNAELRWGIRAFPFFLVTGAVFAHNLGQDRLMGIFLAGALAAAIVFVAPMLPIYTPGRAQIYRWVKWFAMATVLSIGFAPRIGKLAWMLPTVVWPMLWTEWSRHQIRKKLPAGQWPKHLYL